MTNCYYVIMQSSYVILTIFSNFGASNAFPTFFHNFQIDTKPTLINFGNSKFGEAKLKGEGYIKSTDVVFLKIGVIKNLKNSKNACHNC